MKDADRVADAGSGFRVVIGEYGSGKTFFLNLRAIALEKKLVTMHADLNPDRRLHATGGQARSLYAELAKNLATRTKPEGGALPGVVEKFISQAKSEAKASGKPAEAVVREKLNHLAEMVNGYDFGRSSLLTAEASKKATSSSRRMPCVGCEASSRRGPMHVQHWACEPSSMTPPSMIS
jgi:hypothetical protein